MLWFGGLADGTRVELDAPSVHYREISISNTHGNSPADFWEACNLVSSGVVRTDYLLSPEMRLAQTEQAFELMIAGKAMKIPINPDPS